MDGGGLLVIRMFFGKDVFCEAENRGNSNHYRVPIEISGAQMASVRVNQASTSHRIKAGHGGERWKNNKKRTCTERDEMRRSRDILSYSEVMRMVINRYWI